MLVANKLDLQGAADNFTALEELYGSRYRMLAVSANEGHNLDRFRRAMFDMLELVRVYTKAPGKKADFTAPYVLHRGDTVIDAARHVHKDFAENLKAAWLYRRTGKEHGSASPKMVERTHLVEDEDVLELHI